MNLKRTALLALPLAATAALLPPATATQVASAESAVVLDAPDDMGHRADIQRVRVTHRHTSVVVAIRHRDLRPHTPAGGSIYVDTDPGQAGPEYILVGGFFRGTDYALVHADGWQQGDRASGSYRLDLDYARDITRVVISRGTLDRPAKVRAAVRVDGQRPDGTWRRDWMVGPRAFSPWVSRG